MWLIVIASLLILMTSVFLLAPIRVIVSWSGWLVRIRLRIFGISIPLWRRELNKWPTQPSAKGSESSRSYTVDRMIHQARAVISNRETVRQITRIAMQLIRGFVRSLHFERGRIHLTVGLADPAQTGMIHGALSAFSGMLTSRWPKLQVHANPAFESIRLRCEGELVLRFRVWDPMRHLLPFLRNFPWRAWRKLKKDLVYS